MIARFLAALALIASISPGQAPDLLSYNFDVSHPGPPITITNQDLTGDGLQLAVATNVWTPMTMTVTGGPAVGQGVPFQLCGEIACCWEPNLGTNLGLGDDGTSSALTLPFNFRMPGALVGGATTSQVRVCSNGYVWLDGTSTLADFTPSAAEFIAQAARIACPWEDFYTPGGGAVFFNTTAYRAIATWRKIDTFAGATTQSRVQLQMFPNGAFTINCWVHEPVTPRTPVFGVSAGLNAASAAIDYSAGHVGVAGTATIFEVFATGTSDLSGKTFVFVPKDDGVSGSYDVSVEASCGTLAVPTLLGAGCDGMTTAVTSPAIAGTSLVLDSTIPSPAVFGLTSLGLVPTAPVPLPGAPACFLHHSNDLGVVPMVIGGGGLTGQTTIALPCLSVFFGLTICSQGAVITAVPLNPLGISLGDAWLTPLGTDN